MFIQRLFPDIKISTETSQEKWLENIEGAIEKHIAAIQETKSGDVSKLQAELKYYKTIIDDTVRLLGTCSKLSLTRPYFCFSGRNVE